MFEKLLTPFTTARPIGTITRDLFVAIGAIIAILGTLGVLTEDQVSAIRQQIDVISGQAPAIIAALGILVAAVTSILRTLNFSTSDRAAEAAKKIDEQIPKTEPIIVKTPGVMTPDIEIPAKPAS